MYHLIKKFFGMMIIIALIIIVMYNIYHKNISQSRLNNIGNNLCDYFYEMGYSWSKGEKFKVDPNDERYKIDKIYRYLPKEIEPPTDLNIDYIFYVNDNRWTDDSPEGKKFWNQMKPYIITMLDEALEKEGLKKNQKNPVIHFRCSDVPFNRNDDYAFPKYSFYKRLNLQNAEIITCAIHLSGEAEQNACKKYVELLKNELDIQYVSCGSIEEDFAKMFYAPILVSTGSSMSFFAGKCNEFIKPKYDEFIHHDEVEDYYDVDDIHEKLKIK